MGLRTLSILTSKDCSGLLSIKLLEQYMVHNEHFMNFNSPFNYFLLLIPIDIFLG